MIKTLGLYIFGWRRVPERLVERMTGFFDAQMRDRGFSGAQHLSSECLRSLSQLGYQRARRESKEAPRFIYFVRELEVIACAVEDDFRGSDIHDDRVRLILEWHRRKEGPNQPPQRNAGSRPSSGDSSASETSISLGPRG